MAKNDLSPVPVLSLQCKQPRQCFRSATAEVLLHFGFRYPVLVDPPQTLRLARPCTE